MTVEKEQANPAAAAIKAALEEQSKDIAGIGQAGQRSKGLSN